MSATGTIGVKWGILSLCSECAYLAKRIACKTILFVCTMVTEDDYIYIFNTFKIGPFMYLPHFTPPTLQMKPYVIFLSTMVIHAQN